MTGATGPGIAGTDYTSAFNAISAIGTIDPSGTFSPATGSASNTIVFETTRLCKAGLLQAEPLLQILIQESTL